MSSASDSAGRTSPSTVGPIVGVGGVVLDRDEAGEVRVVLIQRAHPPSAGAWSLPGGRVERGEPLERAVVREVEEETGLVVRVIALVEVVELIDAAFHFVVLDYACEPIGGELRAGSDARAVARVRVANLSDYGVTDAVARVVAAARLREAPTAST